MFSYFYVCSVLGIVFHCVVLCTVCVNGTHSHKEYTDQHNETQYLELLPLQPLGVNPMPVNNINNNTIHLAYGMSNNRSIIAKKKVFADLSPMFTVLLLHDKSKNVCNVMSELKIGTGGGHL